MALRDEIKFADVHGIRVLEAPRELDVYTVPAFRQAHVESVGAGHYRQVVDLSNTTYIDSTGLGVLVGALKRAKAHMGWVRLVGLSEAVTKCLRLTGLDRVFEIFDSVEAAVADQIVPPAPVPESEKAPIIALSPQALASILVGTPVRQLIADGVPVEEIPFSLRPSWVWLVGVAREFDELAAEFATELADLAAKEAANG